MCNLCITWYIFFFLFQLVAFRIQNLKKMHMCILVRITCFQSCLEDCIATVCLCCVVMHKSFVHYEWVWHAKWFSLHSLLLQELFYWSVIFSTEAILKPPFFLLRRHKCAEFMTINHASPYTSLTSMEPEILQWTMNYKGSCKDHRLGTSSSRAHILPELQ